MRDIKFRAWHKNKNTMLEIAELIFDGANNAFSGINYWSGVLGKTRNFVHKGNIELMQYTGLKDKNGTDIYEGDIVIFLGHKPRVIEWQPTSSHFAGWFAVSKQEGLRPRPMESIFSAEKPNSIEVIGNIYSNPELLDTANKL